MPMMAIMATSAAAMPIPAFAPVERPPLPASGALVLLAPVVV